MAGLSSFLGDTPSVKDDKQLDKHPLGWEGENNQVIEHWCSLVGHRHSLDHFHKHNWKQNAFWIYSDTITFLGIVNSFYTAELMRCVWVCVCTLKASKYRRALLFARQLSPAVLFRVMSSPKEALHPLGWTKRHPWLQKWRWPSRSLGNNCPVNTG